MTECIQTSFEFSSELRQQVVARFDGGTITTEAGALLLHKVEQKTGILRQFARCFLDHRDPERTEHSVAELVRQRIYALALGYEDLNDHDQLRADPLLGMLSGKADVEGRQRRRKQDRGKAGAGKSTLNRLELTPADASRKARYKKIVMDTAAVDDLLVDLYIQRQKRAPRRIVLDLDATDDPLHGHQEGRFFHGYYDQYCYLPLYIFCGEHLLCVRLRQANIDAAAGSLAEVERIVAQIRACWPQTRIILRGDSGFSRDELMTWCEQQNHVHYVFGMARNERLRRIIGSALAEADVLYRETLRPSRVFTEFAHATTTGSWSRQRRVVAKAEHIAGKENPRYVVTSLDAAEWPAQRLYEELYCARGDMENRIKEQYQLFAGRVSTETMRANQLRLYLSAMAYTLVTGLRRLGLRATELARAEAATIRTRLFKIGALVRVSVRRIWLSMASSYPWQPLFEQVWTNLRC